MKEISQAIIYVVNDVKKVWKNCIVWTWNNSYKAVSDTDVRLALRDSMAKNGLAIVCNWIISKIQVDRWEEFDSYSKAMKTKQSVFTEVETKYLLIHTSWESIELAWYGQWVDTQDKGAWKATTYALKNVLMNLFLIPTWEDTDKTHSDDLVVPSTKVETKKWYNIKDWDLDKIQDKLIDTGKSWQDYINWLIKAWYSIWNETKEKILNLW